MDKPRSFAPLLVAGLLLLPVLYVGSYLALVEPAGLPIELVTPAGERFPAVLRHQKYYLFDKQSKRFFWPLEQIDRRVRPKAWAFIPLERQRGGSGIRERVTSHLTRRPSRA